jgi:proteic killer suppression protein
MHWWRLGHLSALTQRTFLTASVRRFANIESVAMRKLAMLNRAAVLDDLRVPPGNRLEALKGDRLGLHSIRVNDQFRICFVWHPSGPRDVEIVDYH